MRTAIQQTEKDLRRKVHALKSASGMTDDEYRTLLYGNWHVDSSRDLDAHQLIDLINYFATKRSPMDAARKRLIAAVGNYFRAKGYHPEDEQGAIISTILRATGKPYDSINDIPLDRLRSLYNAFVTRVNDINALREADQPQAQEEVVDFEPI